MFDTMNITKAVAAVCGALLIFLLGNWAAMELYVPRNADAPQAFAIDTGAEEPAEAVVEMTFEEAFAVADADAGARVWSQCRACHALEAGRNGVGPYLHGVVDRPIGASAGFNYSGALAQVGEVWTIENLDRFITAPATAAPGTSMSFRGISNATDRANLIAYIQSQS
jgi:cytochrome c